MNDEQPLDYAAAGVDIGRSDSVKQRIRAVVESTFTAGARGAFGGFGGMFRIPADFQRPVLVSSADGVGTKLRVAIDAGRHHTVGHDLVNHCVNDILVQGAVPLFFLDYFAAGRLEPEVVEAVVTGVAAGCRENGCSLVGGETAEMPGLYAEGDLDVVGACVGACERGEIVSGERVRRRDEILGLASSGLHTNGYTLARKVVEGAGLSYSDVPEGLDRSLGEVYLEPHRAYAREVAALRDAVEVRGMAHVTGGGLPGNLPRSLGGLGARLDASSWEEPGVFSLIRALGNISEEEMRRVFNLGIGFCVVVPAPEAERGIETLRGAGCESWRIGEVVERGGVEFV